MSKHTPGEWKIEAIYIGFQRDVSFYNIMAGKTNLGSIKDEANARLIASAPELLEALKEAQKVLLICKPIMSHYLEPQEAYNKVAVIIEQAIAKAEGK